MLGLKSGYKYRTMSRSQTPGYTGYMAQTKIIPQCRYEHGPLTRVTAGAGLNGQWTLVGGPGPFGQQGFFVAMYLCPVCGYLEFFDLDPEITLKEEGSK